MKCAVANAKRIYTCGDCLFVQQSSDIVLGICPTEILYKQFSLFDPFESGFTRIPSYVSLSEIPPTWCPIRKVTNNEGGLLINFIIEEPTSN
jgi:hypothetical protein